MPLRRALWRRSFAFATLACGLGSFAFASDGAVVPLAERIHGAGVAVVATPVNVSASWRQNAHGDRLIVSRVTLRVEETLKGPRRNDAAVDVEGGTVDGVTLVVSSSPMLVPGERAVFFLDPQSDGSFQPHLRGQGVLKLDDHNFVKGSSLSLDEIRRVTASVSK